jgi:hypothetical protein
VDHRAWIDLAKRVIVEIIDEQHAVVWPEIEARAADFQWSTSPRLIQPHVLTEARKRLRRDGLITETTTTTRGGRNVTVLHFTDLGGRKREFQAAAGRKRLLYARHQGWAQGSARSPRGLIGPGGEQVFHASLMDVAHLGYRLLHDKPVDVAHVHGVRLKGGPVDSAAYLQVVTGSDDLRPPVVVLFEVKNIREWIYPRSLNLHQLLYKAAEFQRAAPKLSVLPVLVCRKRQFRTLDMGKDLGFFTIEYDRQFMLPNPDVKPGAVEEVRTELGYIDLTVTDDLDRVNMRPSLMHLPKYAAANAEQWKAVGSKLRRHYDGLRKSLNDAERDRLLGDLARAAEKRLGKTVDWG